jgi:hypothetical protein
VAFRVFPTDQAGDTQAAIYALSVASIVLDMYFTNPKFVFNGLH